VQYWNEIADIIERTLFLSHVNSCLMVGLPSRLILHYWFLSIIQK